MMLAPTGIVLGPGRLRFWWLRTLDWLERRYAPQVIQARKKMPYQEAEVTRLEALVDKLWP